MSFKIIAYWKVVLAIMVVTLGLLIGLRATLGTSNLQPYHSEAGGFEINYPMDWSAVTENQGDSLVVSFRSPGVRDDDVFHSARIMICSTPLDKTAWSDCNERDAHLSELYKDSVLSRKAFVVRDVAIERIETESKYDEAFFYYARFSSNGRTFFMRGDFPKFSKLDRYAPIFDQMLTSFRLLSVANTNKFFTPTP